MAKNYKTNYYGKRKNGVVGIIIASTIAALLLGAAAGVMGYGTSGFKDWGFSRFVQKNPAAYEQEVGEIPEDTGSAIVEPTTGNGMVMIARQATEDEARFYGVATISQENIFQLSVTYEPAETTFQETDYSIRFSSASSKWAQGKNVADYVKLTHVDGSKEATISVLQPFSEKIIVTASNKKHPDVYAETKIDYLYRSIWLKWDLENGTDTRINPDYTYGFKDLELDEGTLCPELNGNVYLVLNVDGVFRGLGLDPNPLNGDWLIKIPLEFEGQTCVSEVGLGDELHKAIQDHYKDGADLVWLRVREKLSQIEDGDSCSISYHYEFKRVYNGKDYGTTDYTNSSFRDWRDLEADRFAAYFEITPTQANSNQSSIVAG